MEITFRKLTSEDAAAYWALRLEALESQPLAFGPTPEEHRQTSVEDAVVLISSTRQSFVMGAFEEDSLVGISRLDRELLQKERHKASVRAVYVAASHRKRGVAGGLIRAIIEEMATDPFVEQLMLSVGTHNAGAASLYRSLGFVGYGVEPRAMKVASEYVDEEHMVLRLR